MPSKKIQIPILDTFYEELDDAFIDEKISIKEFIWQQLKILCKDAKMGKLNKHCTVQIIKNGVPMNEDVPLKDLKLVELPSIPKWKPESLDEKEIKYFEYKVTDKTFKYLNLYGSFTVLRHEKFGQSVIEDNQKKLDTLIKEKASQELVDDAKKTFEQSSENYEKGQPECLEQVLYSALYPSIREKVMGNLDTEFDKENEDVYKKGDKSSK